MGVFCEPNQHTAFVPFFSCASLSVNENEPLGDQLACFGFREDCFHDTETHRGVYRFAVYRFHPVVRQWGWGPHEPYELPSIDVFYDSSPVSAMCYGILPDWTVSKDSYSTEVVQYDGEHENERDDPKTLVLFLGFQSGRIALYMDDVLCYTGFFLRKDSSVSKCILRLRIENDPRTTSETQHKYNTLLVILYGSQDTLDTSSRKWLKKECLDSTRVIAVDLRKLAAHIQEKPSECERLEVYRLKFTGLKKAAPVHDLALLPVYEEDYSFSLHTTRCPGCSRSYTECDCQDGFALHFMATASMCSSNMRSHNASVPSNTVQLSKGESESVEGDTNTLHQNSYEVESHSSHMGESSRWTSVEVLALGNDPFLSRYTFNRCINDMNRCILHPESPSQSSSSGVQLSQGKGLLTKALQLGSTVSLNTVMMVKPLALKYFSGADHVQKKLVNYTTNTKSRDNVSKEPLSPQKPPSEHSAQESNVLSSTSRHAPAPLSSKYIVSTWQFHEHEVRIDLNRMGRELHMCPFNRNLVLVTDHQGRILLLQLPTMVLLYMWKGYRDAHVCWGGRASDMLFAMYAPRRGLLEVWSASFLRRVSVNTVGPQGILASFRDPHAPQATCQPQVIFLSNQGTLHKVPM